MIEEKNCMMACSSPFILKLETTYVDDKFCYFILEFINGLSLSKLESYGILNYCAYDCLFYFINILFMLDHLRKRDIIHRDLKMSNIMIEENGYLKLIDFGLAKQTKNYTYTIIGTPFYMSPEVVLGRGYSYHCDYWSAGIVLFKLFYGYYPFGNECLNSMEIYQAILHSNLKIPSHSDKYLIKKMNTYEFTRKANYKLNEKVPVSDINKIIKHSLDKNSRDRLCRIKDIKNYAKELNLADIQDMKAEAPYVARLVLNNKHIYNTEDKNMVNSMMKFQHNETATCKPRKTKSGSASINTLNSGASQNEKYEEKNQNEFGFKNNFYSNLKGIDYNQEWFLDNTYKRINYKVNYESSSAIKEEELWMKNF